MGAHATTPPPHVALGFPLLFASKLSLPQYQAVKGQGNTDGNLGPKNYDNLVDGDEFDGGDGQVGVVGDGDKASSMPKMKADEGSVMTSSAAGTKYAGTDAVGGKDSKTLKTKVAPVWTGGAIKGWR